MTPRADRALIVTRQLGQTFAHLTLAVGCKLCPAGCLSCFASVVLSERLCDGPLFFSLALFSIGLYATSTPQRSPYPTTCEQD
jgi:hypothetical protein